MKPKSLAQRMTESLTCSFCTWLIERRAALLKSKTKNEECLREMYSEDAERYRFAVSILMYHLRDALRDLPRNCRKQIGARMAARFSKTLTAE